MANTFGTLFRLTTFGESHGAGVGAVIDGCPAGIPFDEAMLRRDLARRRPGQANTTSRDESDTPEILSGVFEGRTIGSPIAVLVRNTNQRSKDYDALKDVYRPSHADFTYDAKYGHRDHRGGGRSSARETLARVVGGSVARMYLATCSTIDVTAAVTSLGAIDARCPIDEMESERVYASAMRVDDAATETAMQAHLDALRPSGDSTGGIVSVAVKNVPAGIGEPIYDKLSARLAGAMMSINGATGFEIGAGFNAARSAGSLNNDQFVAGDGAVMTSTNNSGGIQGGISNGMPIVFRVAFKPPSSIAKQQSMATTSGSIVEHAIEGRHDPSIVIRAVPVVEAMTLLVLADLWLLARASATQEVNAAR